MAGVHSRTREVRNIELTWEKPIEVPNFAPSFKDSEGNGNGGEGLDFSIDGEDPETGNKGKGAVINEPIYTNRNNYSEPQKYPDRRSFVVTFPAV